MPISFSTVAIRRALVPSRRIRKMAWTTREAYGSGTSRFLIFLRFHIAVNGKGSNKISVTALYIQRGTGLDRNIPAIGFVEHEALHEAIISPEVWNEVQAINRERTRLSADNAPPKPFLFTGKLICADCKAPLQGNRETQRRKNGTFKSTFPISAPVIQPPATARAHGTPSMK